MFIKIILRCKTALRKLYYITIKKDPKVIAYYAFCAVDRDRKLRLDYPLNNNSLVIDVGGYIGDYASDIYCKYGCKVYVFEPIKIHADYIRNRFSNNENIKVIQAALGCENKEMNINVNEDKSSLYTLSIVGNKVEKIRMISAVEYITINIDKQIDLLKINIEGGEYELLNNILSYPEIIKNIRFIQIQFHDFVSNAEIMREDIQQRLSVTHKLMWDYPYIWESWARKSSNYD